MIRALAHGDPERGQQIFTHWPLREALLAFESHERQAAVRDYQFRVLSWQIGGGTKPRLPDILNEEDE